MRALLLDLDGTLAESLPVAIEAYHEFLRAAGARGTAAEFDEMNGLSLPEIVRALKARHGLAGDEAALLARYRAILERLYPARAVPAPGARELLAAAAARGIAAAVVTSAERGLAETFLAAHGLAGSFAAVVTAEGLARAKPDPAIYRRALERLRVDVRDALAVEDSPSGVRAATGAGIRTVVLAPDADPSPEVAGLVAARARRLDHVIAHLGPAPTLEPLAGEVRLVARRDEGALDAALARRIDEIWEAERARRPALFDGTLLAFEGRDGVTIRARVVPYRRYVAQRADPSVAGALRIAPLGVSGVLVAAGAVAIGRRAAHVTQHPGALELVPSGTIPADRVGPEGEVDFTGQLLAELREETGVDPRRVARATPFALVLDAAEATYDVCVRLDLAGGDPPPLSSSGERPEYEALAWVPIADASTWARAQAAPVVPATAALLAALTERAGAG